MKEVNPSWIMFLRALLRIHPYQQGSLCGGPEKGARIFEMLIEDIQEFFPYPA